MTKGGGGARNKGGGFFFLERNVYNERGKVADVYCQQSAANAEQRGGEAERSE